MEDKIYIENILNRCVKIENGNSIYYITNENIVRQLKYNRIYNKKEITVDLSKIIFKDNVILEQDIKYKVFWTNYNIIWLYFLPKCNYSYKFTSYYINNILLNILNLKNNETYKTNKLNPSNTSLELYIK